MANKLYNRTSFTILENARITFQCQIGGIPHQKVHIILHI